MKSDITMDTTIKVGRDRCVCCGEYVSEGSWVCPKCQYAANQEEAKSWDRKQKNKGKHKKTRRDYEDEYDF